MIGQREDGTMFHSHDEETITHPVYGVTKGLLVELDSNPSHCKCDACREYRNLPEELDGYDSRS